MNKVILIISIFINQISYSQTTYQSLLINEYNFCGFSKYYFNNTMDGYDNTMVIRMEVDSLVSNNKIERIIIKSKRLFSYSFNKQIYDSIGNRQFDNNNYKKKCLRKEYDELGKIIEIEKESFTNWIEIERYKYDDKDRLIEISIEFKPLLVDTGDFFVFSTICVSMPNKWKGEYDKIGNLISSETYWDNGKIYKQEYQYLSGKLKLVIYDSLEDKRITKKYMYNKGLLENIIYFNHKKRKIKTENYKWQIINKG